MKVQGVFVVATLFWFIGAVATGYKAFESLVLRAPHTTDRPADVNFKWEFVAFASAVGFAFLIIIPCILLPLSRREAVRIKALEKPRWYHFFHKWRLLAFCIVMPCNVIIAEKTEKHFIACLVIGGLCCAASLGIFLGLFANILPNACGCRPNNDFLTLSSAEEKRIAAKLGNSAPTVVVNHDPEAEPLIKYNPETRS
eukprot:m.61477 g.61477  ORF g.61477 m.61477 type:complete len:198 (+) comp22989_c0_seq1:278-871(+)